MFGINKIKILTILACCVFIYQSTVMSAEVVETNENSVDIENILDDSNKLLDSGDIDAALINITNVIEKYPDNDEAHYLLGKAYSKKRQNEKSVASLKEAIRLAPEKIEYLISLALLYESSQDAKNAIEVYIDILKKAAPDSNEFDLANKKIKFLEATQFARKGMVDKALPLFLQLVEKYPDDYLISYSLGLAYLVKSEFDLAIKYFTDTISLKPDFTNAYFNLASAYERSGNLDEAIKNLQKIIEVSPDSGMARRAEVRLGIIEGRILKASQSLNEALSVFKSVLEKEPNNALVLFEMSEIYFQINEADKGIDTLKKLIKVSPRNFRARFILVDVYMKNNNIDTAIAELEEISTLGAGTPHAVRSNDMLERIEAVRRGASQEEIRFLTLKSRFNAQIQADPNNAEAHFNLGSLYRGNGQYEDAKKEFDIAKSIDPNNIQIYFELAFVTEQLQLFDEAIDSYAQAIRLDEDPDKADRIATALIMVIGKKYFRDGDMDKAAEAFESVYERQPENAMAYFFLGIIHSREDRLLKSIDSYEEVVRLMPGHIGARLNMAMVLERLNREEDAISEYRKIVRSGPPDETLIKTAKERLEAAERRIKGFSLGINYSLSINDNSNLSDSDTTDEFSSSLSTNIAYIQKLKNGVRLRLVTAPTYTTYHIGRFDSLNTSSTISATILPRKYTLVGGYTHRTSRSLQNSGQGSSSNVLFAEGSTRMKLPPIFSMFSGRKVTSGLSANISYSDNDTPNPLFRAFTYSFGGGINQPFSDRSSINLTYSLTLNKNKNVLGSDYAYQRHALGFGYSRRITQRLGSNLRYTFSRYNYVNFDSFSGFRKYRRNNQNQIVIGLFYNLHQYINLFTNYSWVINDSNLPVGFVLTEEDIAIAQQSASLGDYRRGSINFGISYRF